MVSSDDEDSLLKNVPLHSIRIPIDTDTTNTITEQFEDCATNEYIELHDVIVAPVIPLLELYFNNTSIIQANERARSLLAACFGVVPDFSLDNEPYNGLNKNLLPTNKIYKKELMRKQPLAKSLCAKKM